MKNAQSAPSGTERDTFGEADIHIADLRVVRLHAAETLDNQVVVCRAVNNQTGLREAELFGRYNLQNIRQAFHGVEDGFQIVVAVCALADHAQADVDLAVGVEKHKIIYDLVIYYLRFCYLRLGYLEVEVASELLVFGAARGVCALEGEVICTDVTDVTDAMLPCE